MKALLWNNPRVPYLVRLECRGLGEVKSHQIGNSWVVPKESFHLLPLTDAGLRILPRIPNQKRTFVFCLAPASRVDDLAFPLTPVLSVARLGTCASPN